MAEVQLSGKARVGIVYGSGSRFTLTVREHELVLHCFKDYRFTADDIVRLEPDGPRWLSRGVRIVHTVREYPRGFYFSCSGGLPRIEAALAVAGFEAAGKMASVQRGLQAWHLLAALLAFLFLGNLLVGRHV